MCAAYYLSYFNTLAFLKSLHPELKATVISWTIPSLKCYNPKPDAQTYLNDLSHVFKP